MKKMSFLSLAVSVLVFSTMCCQAACCRIACCQTAAVERTTEDPYRVIFNCDGHSVFVEAKGSVETIQPMELWVQIRNLTSGDGIDVALNGQNPGPMPRPEDRNLIKFALTADQLRTGVNPQVGVRLNHRSAEATVDIILATVEIHVDCK